MKIKERKVITLYSLQKFTNSVVKWTGIVASLCKEYNP